MEHTPHHHSKHMGTLNLVWVSTRLLSLRWQTIQTNCMGTFNWMWVVTMGVTLDKIMGAATAMVGHTRYCGRLLEAQRWELSRPPLCTISFANTTMDIVVAITVGIVMAAGAASMLTNHGMFEA
jgi:hypothetical protein